MISIIDTSFYSGREPECLADLVARQQAALGYIGALSGSVEIEVIKHREKEESVVINGIRYTAFKGRNLFGFIPYRSLRYIRKKAPGFVIVQGLGFPLQVIFLKFFLRKGTRILVQHHGEQAYSGIKKRIQRWADPCVSAYLFTGLGNAREWIRTGIIRDGSKCFESLEASTHFTPLDKQASKKKTGMTGEQNFLWVGRLNAGKDPLNVLHAFGKLCARDPDARLYMIYQTDELLPEILKLIVENEHLWDRVILKGAVAHPELQAWYSAADFFISGSHHEGSGYALLEAMACGCIPVVTDIPSFRAITGQGEYGFLYAPGEVTALYETLLKLKSVDREKMSVAIRDHFERSLSFSSIAKGILSICEQLSGK